MRLKGKQALVTGSCRGIGRGIVLKLAQEGATIAVHYNQNHEAASDTLALIRESGSDGIIVRADVSLVDDIRRMFAEVRDTFGTLDIFVSNARRGPMTVYGPALDLTLDKWAMAFDAQARAFLVSVQEAAPLMPNGGRILATTCAQGALESAVRYFAVALAARGITVNAINPGFTEDGLPDSLADEAALIPRDSHRRRTPMGRLGTPIDIGNVVSLLCADEASWITGQLIAADGGASLMDAVLPLELQLAQPVAEMMS